MNYYAIALIYLEISGILYIECMYGFIVTNNKVQKDR